MKFTLSLVILATAASQALAVVPTPIAACTKTVVVNEKDIDGCDAFAARNGVTFDSLLKWNMRLRADCLNLDLHEKICVSVTPGAGNNDTATGTAAPPVPGPTATPTRTAAAPTNKPPTATGATDANSGATSAVLLDGKTSITLGLVSALLSFVYIL
ncbi:hypothetical protein BGW41_000980 [Actinomortierella wolfii]|nr:hypothetical protein BGW41_000980 [Actinomortierella wolfii]